jgi:hypothetical protein
LETGQTEGAYVVGNGRRAIAESNLEVPEGSRSKNVNQTKPVKESGLVNSLRIGELGATKEPFKASVYGEHFRRDYLVLTGHRTWKVKKTKMHLTLGRDIGLMEA